MRHHLAILLLLLLVGCKSSEQPKPTPTHDTASAEVFAAAIDAVEMGHLMAAPIDALPETAIKGMAIPMYSEFPGLPYEKMASRVATVGATHVSLVVTWNQRTIYDNRIRPEPGISPPDERVKATIHAAHKAGLKVMLFPIVHVVQRSEGEWRGRMAPTDVSRWHSEYSAFIDHYAKLASFEGVEILSIGSELSSMEADETFWRELITQVRQTYSGKLVYSANWDHFTAPAFWDAVDYLGVSSYFEVAKSPSDSTFLVAQRWRKQRDELLAFARSHDRKLLLTEVGYPAVLTAAVHPWDYTGNKPPNLNQQLAAFRSLVDGWADVSTDDFAGAFVWHGWGWGGPADTSYNVFDKPAESAVRAWFGSSSPR